MADASPLLPTERLYLDWPAGVAETDESREEFDATSREKMLALAADLRARGERPWFEVWHRGIPGRKDTNDSTFDAVEVAEDGTIETLRPYAEILAGSDA